MGYGLGNRAELDRWLATDPDASLVARVLVWLDDLLEDPQAVEASPVPGYRQPVVFAWVPHTNVAVSYWIGVAPIRIVMLVRIETPTDL